jgi:hypothetical protein
MVIDKFLDNAEAPYIIQQKLAKIFDFELKLRLLGRIRQQLSQFYSHRIERICRIPQLMALSPARNPPQLFLSIDNLLQQPRINLHHDLDSHKVDPLFILLCELPELASVLLHYLLVLGSDPFQLFVENVVLYFGIQLDQLSVVLRAKAANTS